jgi:hypothetical protein
MSLELISNYKLAFHAWIIDADHQEAEGLATGSSMLRTEFILSGSVWENVQEWRCWDLP